MSSAARREPVLSADGPGSSITELPVSTAETILYVPQATRNSPTNCHCQTLTPQTCENDLQSPRHLNHAQYGTGQKQRKAQIPQNRLGKEHGDKIEEHQAR